MNLGNDKPEKRQGVWMDPQKKISQCFSLGEEDSASPFPLEEEEEEIDGRAFLKMTEQRFRDYGMKGGPAFIPPIHTINESAPEFKLCIDDILRRIKNMGPVVDSNEAMRCEYISTILHTAVSISQRLVLAI
ncbi:hypothetical protein GLOIN_2v1734289 [Rhizophagus irregularis DAOM 181602=DAOM 197198]|nr:hypothetical protein GLOIN_2v1734289 [Rhizophagus irregularis DAOM 181602=DAOM 197198]